MKPRSYGPFPYSPIIDRPRLEWPNGAHVALWIIPNIEYFSMMEKPGGYGAGDKIPDVVMWSRARLRQPRRRVPHHGDAGPLRHPRHGRAQLQPLRRASAHHGGGREAQVGVDGPQREQHPPAQRSRARRGGADRPQHLRDHREGDRQAPEGLAQLRPAGDLGHARPSGRQRLRIRRRLVQRRSALPDDARRRPHHRLDALHPAAQRQVGDRAALRLGRRLPADDLRPVRRALQGGREVRPRHGDRAASLSDRRAAPHRRLRRGAKVHLQAQEGLEGYRLGNCTALSRAGGGRRDERKSPAKRRAERRAAERAGARR